MASVPKAQLKVGLQAASPVQVPSQREERMQLLDQRSRNRRVKMTIRWYKDTPIKTAALATGNFQQLNTRLTWEFKRTIGLTRNKSQARRVFDQRKRALRCGGNGVPEENPAGQPGSPRPIGRLGLRGAADSRERGAPRTSVRERRMNGKVPCPGKPGD